MAKRFFALLMILISGGAICVSASPESNEDRLIRENRELRKKLLEKDRELADYRIWIASLGIDFRKNSVSDREKRAAYILDELAKRGNVLSMAALTVSDECRRLLRELPLGPARKAQVELRLDELERAAGSFAGLTIPGNDNAASCRVLAINSELQVAVLSAGTGAGVFPGMIFHAKNKPALQLRVIGTRFEGSVAELSSGSWADLVPGMEMSALKQVKEQKKSIITK